MPKSELPFRQLAAIDLGSNSFHMVVARPDRGELRIQERRSEKVQLGAGLDARNRLTEDIQKRALAALKRFAERIAGMPDGSVRIVGTNALRQAQNAEAFIARAQKLLGHPIEIIAGREEARLIYLGVAHTLADDSGRRLVIDIGGGSTEFIVGERFEPLVTESLHMGCVSYARRFFPRGTITPERFEAAYTAARQELLPVRAALAGAGWHSAVGASGSIKAVQTVIETLGWSLEGITASSLDRLCRRVAKAPHVDSLRLPGLEESRQGIFVPGLAILSAAFDSLGIAHMTHSPGALREGALYDLIGRYRHEDVRDRTVQSLMRRNHVDEAHAQRVAKTALALFDQMARRWQLDVDDRELLRWASLLHEIGQDISHSNFQKHGAYVIQHADLPGFSRQEQKMMAVLVRNHRRKFSVEALIDISVDLHQRTLRLCVLLRLAVALHHGRNEKRLPKLLLRERRDALELFVPANWAHSRSLTLADLEQEAGYLQGAGFIMTVRFSAPGG